MISNARSVIDHVCEDYTSMCGYLAADANIVRNGRFEDAMVKVMSGVESELNLD